MLPLCQKIQNSHYASTFGRMVIHTFEDNCFDNNCYILRLMFHYTDDVNVNSLFPQHRLHIHTFTSGLLKLADFDIN